MTQNSVRFRCQSKQVSRWCIIFPHELTYQIFTNQSIKIGRRAWQTRHHGEKKSPSPHHGPPKKLYEYNYVFALSNKMLLIYPSTDKDKESTRCLIIIKLMFTHVDMSQMKTAKEVSFRFFYSFLGKFSRYRCCQKQEVYVGTKSSVGLLYFVIFVFSKLVIIRYHSLWTHFRHFAVIPNHLLGALK